MEISLQNHSKFDIINFKVFIVCGAFLTKRKQHDSVHAFNFADKTSDLFNFISNFMSTYSKPQIFVIIKKALEYIMSDFSAKNTSVQMDVYI